MKKVLFLLSVLVVACTVPQTSETKEDTVAILSEDTLQMATDETIDQVAAVDTVFNPVNVENRLTEPALVPGINYVYSKDGLDVWKSSDAQEPLGHIDYKQKVQIYDNQDGNYILIDFEGKPGYVLSDFLLPLPVPEIENVTEYFLRTLMLSEDPVERRSKEDAEEGSFSFIDYKFENGFTVMTGSQYESGYTNVKLPNLTLKQTFLFASYFYESFRESFKEFPTDARDEELPEQKHILVQIEDGIVLTITVGNGEGCYWEDTISDTGSGMVMSSSGGC